MTGLRDREKLKGDIRPLVVNVMNFSKASDGEPTLLSFDDAKTLFHEFGHALTDFEAALKIAKPDGSDAAPNPEGAPLAERRIAHAARVKWN